MPYSGYHFWRPNVDPVIQANWFVTCMGTPKPSVVWDDVETTVAAILGVPKGSSASVWKKTTTSTLKSLTSLNRILSTEEKTKLSTAQYLLSGSITDDTLLFCNTLKNQGFTVGIYTSPGFAQAWFTGPNAYKLAEFILWVAHIGVAKPTIPAPWNTYGQWDANPRVVLWQYSWTEVVPGFPEQAVDMNYLSVLAGETHVFFKNGTPYSSGEIETVTNKLVVVQVTKLNVRKTPSTTAPIVDYVYFGNILPELELKTIGSNIWARVGVNQWIAKYYLGSTYAIYKLK
jgi:GH25 family lysozyme M1 (1,4-beta-N-acetylmuramidase)